MENENFDIRCEWEVPKYAIITQNHNSDIHTDPQYVNMLPDFGFFKKIKDQFQEKLLPKCESRDSLPTRSSMTSSNNQLTLDQFMLGGQMEKVKTSKAETFLPPIHD